jgi:drug/metabolite transporter (DMT)-like permease
VTAAYLYTLLAVLVWTTGPVGSKAVLLAESGGPGPTPLQVAFWAIAVGWIALLALTAARGRLGRLKQVSPRGWIVLVAIGLFGWMGYPVGMNVAYTRLAVPDALVISNLSPVLVTVLQAALFGRLLRVVSGWERAPEREPRWSLPRLAAGFAFCLLGVAMIATEGQLARLGGMRSLEGALAAVGAACCWAVYSNLGRFVATRPGADSRGMGDLQNLAGMPFGLAAMAMLLAASGRLTLPTGYQTALYFGGLGPSAVPVWLIVGVMGLLNYCAGYPFWLHSLEIGHRLGEAHRLPPLTYLLLVTTAVFGWIVLREAPGPGFWQGTVLIAAGNAAILIGRRREAEGDGPRSGRPR